MIGMMTSPTSDVTMAPKAAPIMTPTARSTTLPFIANSRNSLSMPCSTRFTGRKGTTGSSVDQPGMHHRVPHRDARGFGDRHHRQAELLVHLAEQRHRIFDRCRIGFDEE